MYRRFLTAGAAAMLTAALLLSGCSKQTQNDTAKQTETQAVTESSTESETGSETEKETQTEGGTKETAKKKAESETVKEKESTSEKGRETQTDKESAASEKETKQSTGSSETAVSSEVHTVIGTLEELSMDQVVLLSDNGNELAFSTDDVKIDLPSGIRIGNLISIDYTGKITPKGTGKATAVRIAGSADVFESEAETEKATEAAAEKATEKATEQAAGQTARKNKKSSEAATEAKTDESKAAETKADTSKKQTVKGILEKISMTGMTIKTSDGKELKFRIVQVPLYLEKGLTKGMSIKVTYRGELQSESSDQESVEVVRIQSAD